jgi:hypothetical protein
MQPSTVLHALSKRLDSVVKSGFTTQGFSDAVEATRKIVSSPRINRTVLKNAIDTFQKIKRG